MRRHARIKQQARLGNQQIFMHGRTRRNRAAPHQMDIAMRRRVMMLLTEGAAVKNARRKRVVPEQAGQSIRHSTLHIRR